MSTAEVIAAWDGGAEGYRDYWPARFRPFVLKSLEAFRPGDGALGVPGCGPGAELLLLAQRFPARRILASDPGANMVRAAQTATAHLTRVAVTQGLADSLGTLAAHSIASPLGGVYSSFVLQLLPDRAAALADWAQALAPAGQIAALYWPAPQPDTAWGRLSAAIQRITGRERPEWEDELKAQLGGLGLELLGQSEIERELAHDSPQGHWEAYVGHGPGRLLVQRYGAEAAEACGKRWLQDHGLEERGGQWRHTELARLWLLRRSRS